MARQSIRPTEADRAMLTIALESLVEVRKKLVSIGMFNLSTHPDLAMPLNLQAELDEAIQKFAKEAGINLSEFIKQVVPLPFRDYVEADNFFIQTITDENQVKQAMQEQQQREKEAKNWNMN